MFLKNNTARLITINGKERKNGKTSHAIDLMPAGEAVDVPDALATAAYCKALIADGAVTAVVAPTAEPVPTTPLVVPTGRIRGSAV